MLNFLVSILLALLTVFPSYLSQLHILIWCFYFLVLPAEVAVLCRTNTIWYQYFLFSAGTKAEDQNQAEVLLGTIDRGLLQADHRSCKNN
jgi:hypothetical protein